MKKHRSRSALLLLAAVSLSVVGCSPSGTIRADSVREHWTLVANRHDAYVRADPTLGDANDPRRSAYLRSTQIIRQQLDAATPSSD
jgi:hypothetical protein